MDSLVARQPIFDRNKKVVAYELLFRTSLDEKINSIKDDNKTLQVIDSGFMNIGFNKLTDGKRAFINFTRNLLLDEIASIFPKDSMTVEILENVIPDEKIISACKKLKHSGYIIALDDFIAKDLNNPLIKIADIIKVDFVDTTENERKIISERLRKNNTKLLAEKVETYKEFEEAKELGYTYFQGYFFSKPYIIQGKNIPAGKMSQLRLLQEVNKPDIEPYNLEQIIKSDVSLTYKLLRFINSSYFAFRNEIKSIKHAISLLGINELKKWISLVVLTSVAGSKPEELLRISLLRARACELIAIKLKKIDLSQELFLTGMFSLIDAIFDNEMPTLLENLALPDTILKALIIKDGFYNDILNIIIHYEKLISKIIRYF